MKPTHLPGSPGSLHFGKWMMQLTADSHHWWFTSIPIEHGNFPAPFFPLWTMGLDQNQSIYLLGVYSSAFASAQKYIDLCKPTFARTHICTPWIKRSIKAQLTTRNMLKALMVKPGAYTNKKSSNFLWLEKWKKKKNGLTVAGLPSRELTLSPF